MSLGNFKAIFFDNDGLLVNSEPLYLRATQEVFSSVGLEITEEWFIREQLAEGRSTFELARRAGFSEQRIRELRSRRNELYGEILRREVVLKDGVRECLEMLRGKCVMGVVTSARKDHFEIGMERAGIRDFFDFFLTADDVVNLKPDPELYLRAVELSQQPKEHCLALEDSPHGAEAAKAAGITCYALPSTFTKGLDFSHTDKVVGNMRELPPLLGL